MKMPRAAAKRKASPNIPTESALTDSYVIAYIGRRYRIRPLLAIIIAAESGLGAR